MVSALVFPLGYVETLKYIKAWYNYSLKQKMLHNLQYKSLLRIEQLTTNHTVRQCTCISEEEPDLSIMGAVLVQTSFVLEISKDIEA